MSSRLPEVTEKTKQDIEKAEKISLDAKKDFQSLYQLFGRINSLFKAVEDHEQGKIDRAKLKAIAQEIENIHQIDEEVEKRLETIRQKAENAEKLFKESDHRLEEMAKDINGKNGSRRILADD